ncbi:uncharacterized protein STEHIDRAFT_50595, partial [Stereum hirsutum FP-91666 SS1]|uniref:uncharacterized protein n=1 Tax=Stereum hirsutum (strain FP-91666) TaxID=721885 RepID=UPI000440D3C0
RYRLIPSFGSGTIRPFRNNASDMKKLAARNFEDLLQCAIPAFENILSEPHNTIILTLLYRLAEWHALAKLRLHTDSTLSLLRAATIDLGSRFRRFRDFTCPHFPTTELPRERDARDRRQRRKEARQPQTTAMAADSASPDRSTTRTSPTKRLLNLLTYKFHALGDYVSTIQFFGTTDSYSTQIVSSFRDWETQYHMTHTQESGRAGSSRRQTSISSHE